MHIVYKLHASPIHFKHTGSIKTTKTQLYTHCSTHLYMFQLPLHHHLHEDSPSQEVKHSQPINALRPHIVELRKAE